ncbi:hypothetical protein [Paenibacillus sp.]|uniref:hypothetical protein n=1 Tax=Paenibacillus sp. TaxID=58172 RepID=UPI002D37DABF|nr:hypothetical protein [Paenibacillus sp.]HZG85110.1 hypothetical protein [Paenibacillus sp.]
MIKKIVIGATAAVLGAYLLFMIVSQVAPYVQWMLQRGETVKLSFADAEQFQASDDVAAPAKAWLRLPETPEGAALTVVEYADDGFTTPQITARYETDGRRFITYSIGGNYELAHYRGLKTVDIGNGLSGEVLVGRDKSVVIKWRDPAGPPYRYLYFYEPSMTEEQMIRFAERFAAAAATT